MWKGISQAGSALAGGVKNAGGFSNMLGGAGTPDGGVTDAMEATVDNTQGVLMADQNPLPGLGADPTPWNPYD